MLNFCLYYKFHLITSRKNQIHPQGTFPWKALAWRRGWGRMWSRIMTMRCDQLSLRLWYQNYDFFFQLWTKECIQFIQAWYHSIRKTSLSISAGDRLMGKCSWSLYATFSLRTFQVCIVDKVMGMRIVFRLSQLARLGIFWDRRTIDYWLRREMDHLFLVSHWKILVHELSLITIRWNSNNFCRSIWKKKEDQA